MKALSDRDLKLHCGIVWLFLLSTGCRGPVVPNVEPEPPAAQREGFSFALMGDQPYGPCMPEVENNKDWTESFHPQRFLKTIGTISSLKSKIRFIVHDGDIHQEVDWKNGHSCDRCDGRLKWTHETIKNAGVPFFYTPGDNEWFECLKKERLNRLNKIRQLFLPVPNLLTGNMKVTRQDEGENLRWQVGEVLFVTLHAPDVPPTLQDDFKNTGLEFKLSRLNMTWIEQAHKLIDQGKLAAMFITQVNACKPVFSQLKEKLVNLASAVRGPVVLVHGDTAGHDRCLDGELYRFETPAPATPKEPDRREPSQIQISWTEVTYIPSTHSFTFTDRNELGEAAPVETPVRFVDCPSVCTVDQVLSTAIGVLTTRPMPP